MRPLLPILQLALLAAITAVPALAGTADLLEFDAPPFLDGPSISRSAFGVTYVYKGRSPYAASELQLTVVAVPAGLAAEPGQLPTHCLSAFLDELRVREPTLMLGADTRHANLGALSLLERRWLSQRGERMMTGVTACGLHRGYFVSANYADDLQSAVQSFPALRAALEHVVLRF